MSVESLMFYSCTRENSNYTLHHCLVLFKPMVECKHTNSTMESKPTNQVLWHRRKRSLSSLTLLSVAVLLSNPTILPLGACEAATFRKKHGSPSSFRFRNDDAKISESWSSYKRRLYIIIYPPSRPMMNSRSTPSPSPSFVDTSIPSMAQTDAPSMELSGRPTVSESPSLSFSPTESPYDVSTKKNTTSGIVTYTSSCNNTLKPANGSSSIIPELISFDYALTLKPDISHEKVIQTIEEVINNQLSKDLMEDCEFKKSASNPREKSFEVMWLNSSPLDTISANETCGSDCRVVKGYLTAGIFYLNRRRLQKDDNVITDPVVAATFGRNIVQLFNRTDLFGPNVVSLEFRGISNNAAYDAFGTKGDTSQEKDTPGVAAIASQSSTWEQQGRDIGWGSAIVAFAGIALIALTVVAVISRKRQRVSENLNNAELDYVKEIDIDDWNELENEFQENHQSTDRNFVVDDNDEKEIQFQSERYLITDDEDDQNIAYIVNEDDAKLQDEEEEEHGVEILHNPQVSGSFQWKTRPPTFVPAELNRPI